MISPDLVPNEIQRFPTLGDLGQAPVFSLRNACSVPDCVKHPGITTTRDRMTACKELQLWRQTDSDFLIDDRAFLYYSFLLGLG